MCMIAPEVHSPCATLENGKKALCVRFLKALHGTLKAAPLAHQHLRKWLEQQGFVINPCDVCVANKMINGKQMTLAWHVDDMKMLHVDPEEVTRFINELKEKSEDE